MRRECLREMKLGESRVDGRTERDWRRDASGIVDGAFCLWQSVGRVGSKGHVHVRKRGLQRVHPDGARPASVADLAFSSTSTKPLQLGWRSQRRAEQRTRAAS